MLLCNMFLYVFYYNVLVHKAVSQLHLSYTYATNMISVPILEYNTFQSRTTSEAGSAPKLHKLALNQFSSDLF